MIFALTETRKRYASQVVPVAPAAPVVLTQKMKTIEDASQTPQDTGQYCILRYHRVNILSKCSGSYKLCTLTTPCQMMWVEIYHVILE